ncbi:DUF2627 domain-containing protein [Halalkalibacterium halodurans]|jgi:hypothetical protein|uniref:BH2767 protein n=2 Tax=Halalkalibacterium halodurans TaxID=86665 RepID=Q9K983_HALH5|nr:DUF2627 domain-containing protein [Halalkalibacterium halodurans]MED3647945.1 DUF2627 domain-containing protein [Halalkalibacterium halodurans]MED4122601.1 DUF2627 domain-containing protein [Halalkalibacterium halodurans]MED4161511.1 DUF2627 domain-containing protein [Halalkalibacterium halodurans]MED4172308.1 DUF2627 domain-containing protein [Halalkalibacterium halodurans]TES54210.1 DUF2627 domain-containing protein [Halalkalibacterium halodurans]
MLRFIALMLLVLPCVIAGYGIKLMRDTIMQELLFPWPSLAIQFLAGFILFVAGFSFIGGFIFHRDRKNGKVAPRFQKRPKQDNPH